VPMRVPLMAVIVVVVVVVVMIVPMLMRGLAGRGLAMCMLMAVFMFHRYRLPSMLKCLHTPQAGEKNACP
jgi:uncharacterized membrane protein YphA (DoxX/SURF4 family)